MAAIAKPNRFLSIEKPRKLSIFISKFTDFYKQNRQPLWDLAILFVLTLLTILLLLLTDTFEKIYYILSLHETMELDEILLIFAVVLPGYTSIFAIRRWAEANQRLKLANTDPLTGLFNRRKAEETIQSETLRAKRYERPLALILLDLDHFKQVNDKYGHPMGDMVLSVIAGVLQRNVRGSDSLARWGGEEFIVIASETDLNSARLLAERLRLAIEQTPLYAVSGITASLGVVELRESEDFLSMIERADLKMYQAKDKGRNRVAV
ncbi:MAG TPA: GGDEF domain-containing protein [Anaerolineales bacterium]|nr:GGDEF domain-containing protein [Anaerolineales bacterium]HNO30184.1 GGDEF domain-containing protein [Anaerolineales bacterium]